MSDEKTDKWWQFKPGQSGNPGGSVAGYRKKINRKFLEALAKDFETNGASAIEQCRIKDPAAYVRTLASLMPKQVEVSRPLEDFNDDELITAVRALQSFLAPQGADAGAAIAGEPPQAH